MPCKNCNQNVGTQSVVAGTVDFDGPDFVLIEYNGYVGNHMVLSPRKFFKSYGLHSKGDRFKVHVEDQKAAPAIFVLVVEETAPAPEAAAVPNEEAQNDAADTGNATTDPAAATTGEAPATAEDATVTVDAGTEEEELPPLEDAPA